MGPRKGAYSPSHSLKGERMANKRARNNSGAVNLALGDLNPKQKQFCQARSRYVGYGGVGRAMLYGLKRLAVR